MFEAAELILTGPEQDADPDQPVLTMYVRDIPFQGYYRGIGHLMITLFATLVQIPIRVVISYALFGRMGIQAVAIGTTIGWACMVVFELLMYRRYGRVEALRKNDR